MFQEYSNPISDQKKLFVISDLISLVERILEKNPWVWF